MAVTSADILVRCLMSSTTGLPADTVINDFAFRFTGGGAPTDAELDILLGDVDAFYNDIPTGQTQTIAKYLGESISRAVTHEMQFFNIAAPGSPRYTSSWLGPAAPATPNTNMPTEVAGVLSFHGDLTGVLEESGATRPRARRRGRVYIGPLTGDAITTADDSPLLGTGFLNVARAAAVDLADEAAAHDFTWSVYSRTNVELYAVVGGWTDNAPDTQRRRGREATARTVYTI